MKNSSRRGWIPPRTAGLRGAMFVLVAAAVILATAQTVRAAADFPLRPMRPLPVFETTPGLYGVAHSGAWALSAGPTATINLRLAGPPIGSWLYIAGRDENLPGGDPLIRVAITNGAGVTRVLTRVPVVYATATQRVRYVNRVEITRYLAEGLNKIAISGWDYEFPEGAFAYAVYDQGAAAPQKLIQVRDGADIGWCAMPPPFGPDSEVAGFRFDASAAERTARVVLAISDAEAGRGDEVFGFTGTGVPADQLRDSDGDGRLDIVNRGVALTRVDGPPLGVDPANAAGALEAHRRAFSLAEDCLGVPRSAGGCSVGPEFNIVSREYAIPAGHGHAEFQVQSEDPENGDSFMLLVAINELPLDGMNPVPDIQVIKNVTPTVMPEPGGVATFEVIVTNPAWSGESLRLASLVDDVFGAITSVHGRILSTTCTVPRTLPIGGTYRCTFVAAVSGIVEAPHRDVVTASGTGSVSGAPVSASDDAIVTFTRGALGSLGDRVWLDADRDGAQDAGETGIDGVAVLLKDAGGNVVAATTTATSGGVVGFYGFPNLAAGTYAVEVVPPAGLAQTYDLDGLGTANAAVRALAAGERADNVDFGYAPPLPRPDFTLTKAASIDEGYPGDLVTYVFTVTNTGNVPLDAVVVTDDKLGYIGTVSLALRESKQLTKTDIALPVCGTVGKTVANRCDGTAAAEGFCSLPNTATATWDVLTRTAKDCVDILPFGTIGDYVWEDLNKDGVQDAGEPPLAGVTVTLSGAAGATAVTDAAGAYLFTRLKAGAYVVDSGGKGGFALTTGNDPLPVALGVGQAYLLADFGYWRTAPEIAVTKTADPTFGYLYRADPSTWPNTLVPATLDVAYTAAVTNPGDEPLANVTLADDPAAIVFSYQSGDADGDGLLDLTETWIYTAAWSYDAPGVYPDTVTARGTGVFSGTPVSAEASASVEAVGCGQCLGKVSELTLRWNGTAAASIEVVVENRAFADPVAFQGTVQPGGFFSFGPLSSPNGGFDGTLGTNISIYADGIFVATVHTSCSQPIYPGQDWGAAGALAAGSRGPVTVIDVSSKHGGQLCPIVGQ